MPLITDGRVLIQHAFKHHYTIPAFNVCSAEMVRACVEAAEEENAPIILQTYPADSEQLSPKHMHALVKSFADDSAVPIVLHMDHGPDFETDIRCLRAGYGSVMYDGAEQALEDVIATTRKLADVAHVAGAAVEVAAESFNAGVAEYTRPDEALRLKQESHADMIAVSVGSEHGSSSTLDLNLLQELARTLQSPLVLHGGSGISASDYEAARNMGVVKANIGSALYRVLRSTWQNSSTAQNHREVYASARSALKQVAKEKIRMMAAKQQASGFLKTHY